MALRCKTGVPPLPSRWAAYFERACGWRGPSNVHGRQLIIRGPDRASASA